MSRAFHLCYEQGYLPQEAYEIGLFDPNLPDEELSNYISRTYLTKLQKALNPAAWVPLLKDKGIFYRYCTALGVPVPKLYAIFFRDNAGWSFDGSVPASRDKWEKFIESRLPSEFVIKPSQGSFGEGVNIFCRTNAGFINAFGKQCSAADIYETMLLDPKYDSFIIQQRLKNHPDLVHLTGTQSLHTVRLVTSVDAAGHSRAIHARLKLSSGQTVTDNWRHGQGENAKAELSLGEGVLGRVIIPAPDGPGVKVIHTHPKTGIHFDGFRLPFWKQACSLVERAAIKFLPIRTIGWDVALTPDGPIILEGNIWWDPPNQNPRMKIISDTLRRDAEGFGVFNRAGRTLNIKTKPRKIRLVRHNFFGGLELPVREFFRIVRFCCAVTPLYNPDYLKVFLRALRLWRKEQFTPEEAFQFGLFKPDISNAELSECVSQVNLKKIQLPLNPLPWVPLVRNKSIFYRYCMASGVPVPKLYAIFFKTNAGWSYDGSVLAARDDWEKFFDIQLPSEFVVKPSEGAFGALVNVFTKADKGFIDGFGKQYKAADIYDEMLSAPKYDSFLFQERLKNHPELMRLTNTHFLQTARIVTFVDAAGRCHVLYALLKLILGQSVIDNWQHGLSGNATAFISLSDGLLGPAVTRSQDGSELITIPDHPKTGVPFDRFRLPFWPEICSLVKETAIKFLPVRTIGWDIALTPDGPVILEANIWWGASNQHRRMHIVLEALSGNSK
jgi:glutathione synthase/RimK-type ligase-like ATP-grasp enzyme